MEHYSPTETWKVATCSKVEGTCRYGAKWKKSEGKRQILDDSLMGAILEDEVGEWMKRMKISQ